MKELERLRAVEESIERLEKAWAKELAVMTKKRGFDMYAPKWEKRMKALADKYAEVIAPLKIEQNELADKLNEEAERVRRSKYVDPE